MLVSFPLCGFVSLAERNQYLQCLPVPFWREQVWREMSDQLVDHACGGALNHGDAVLWGARCHLNVECRCKTSHGAERTQLARSSWFDIGQTISQAQCSQPGIISHAERQG